MLKWLGCGRTENVMPFKANYHLHSKEKNMTDFKIDLRINEDGLNSAVKRAQENNIVIPTFAQLRDPVKNVPEKIKKAKETF